MVNLINTLEKEIASSIVQTTNLFDKESFDKEVELFKNTISVDDIEGRYSLTGATDEGFSVGCLNDTFDFILNEKLKIRAFLGREKKTMLLRFHKANIGQAFKRDVAFKNIIDASLENQIIIYTGDCVAVDPTEKTNINLDIRTLVQYEIGIIFKIKGNLVKEFGYEDLNKIVINACINNKAKNLSNKDSLLRFSSTGDRGLDKNKGYFYNELLFNFIEDISIENEMLKKVKAFNIDNKFGIEYVKKY